MIDRGSSSSPTPGAGCDMSGMLFAGLRQNLSDLADAATRGATKRNLTSAELAAEMRIINTAYREGLAAVDQLEVSK